MLDLNTNLEKKSTESDQVNYYKKKLDESEAKIDELVDVVAKLR